MQFTKVSIVIKGDLVQENCFLTPLSVLQRYWYPMIQKFDLVSTQNRGRDILAYATVKGLATRMAQRISVKSLRAPHQKFGVIGAI